jgi:hypothetical protein
MGTFPCRHFSDVWLMFVIVSSPKRFINVGAINVFSEYLLMTVPVSQSNWWLTGPTVSWGVARENYH